MIIRAPGADSGDFSTKKLKWDVLAAAAKRGQSIEEIDLSETEHLKPYSIACLAGLGIENEGRVRLRPPNSRECREHLSRMQLPRFFSNSAEWPSCDIRTTNVVIDHVTGKGSGAADRVVQLLLDNQGLSAGEAPTLANHLDEILRNALCHSRSPLGCVVAGQHFPQKKQVELAIVDFGCSIPAHLRRNPKHLSVQDDAEAVVLATENGITGTVGVNDWNEPNSGAGLWELRSYCQSGRGEMAIVSGRAVASFSATVPIKYEFRGGFSGCLVSIRFFL